MQQAVLLKTLHLLKGQLLFCKYVVNIFDCLLHSRLGLGLYVLTVFNVNIFIILKLACTLGESWNGPDKPVPVCCECSVGLHVGEGGLRWGAGCCRYGGLFGLAWP